MLLIRQKGQVIIALIAAMLLMSVLGAGIYSLSTTSSYTELMSNNNDQAYYLAQAGVRYAIQNIFQSHPQNYPSTDFLMPDGNHRFNISIDSNGVITSTGIINSGTFLETRRVIAYNLAWQGSSGGGGGGSLPPPPSAIISFSNDMPSFNAPIAGGSGGSGGSDAVTVNSDNTVNLGGGVTDSYASLWYQGSSVVGNCSAGICNFGLGINVYFDFTFLNEDYSSNSTASADGFTFAIISAINNTRDRTGGAPSGVSIGELLGYAGPGTTADKLGLKPPKMALEFDTYPNTGTGDICSAGNRSDPSPFKDHAALMFWGAKTITGNCSSTYPKGSFDDNQHGAGGSNGDPQNSARPSSPNPSSGYYEGTNQACKSSSNTCNWMEDGFTYSCRIEITRDAANSAYRTQAWIVRTDLSGYTDLLQQSHFQDVMVPFTDWTTQIDRSVTLVAQDNSDFSKVFFGFTEATGASTQQITIANFRTFFPQGSCSYSISTTPATTPPNASYAAAGGPGSTAVTTTNSCPWMAYPVPPSPNNWITISPGSNSAMGNGTVNYTVTTNTGPARTGYINIAGQTLTVIQANGCIFSINPASATPGAGASNGSIAVTASNATCPWTASVTLGSSWLSITSGSSGTGNGAVNYHVDANPGPARIGTITVGGQAFTLTQASGCTYSLSSYNRNFSSAADNSNPVNITTGGTCPWTAVSNDAWITINSGAGGTGSGTINYGVAANNGPARTGTMTIGGRTFTVTQNDGCTYSISPTSVTYNCHGGNGSITVTPSNSACTWTASEGVNWITINSGSSGTGNGTINYTVNPRNNCNPGGSTRSADITVTGGNTCTINETRP